MRSRPSASWIRISLTACEKYSFRALSAMIWCSSSSSARRLARIGSSASAETRGAEPLQLARGDPLRGQRAGERLHHAAVLEKLAHLLGPRPDPLEDQVASGLGDERPAVLAPPDLDVLLVLEPAQPFADGHPVDAEAQAQLPLGRKALAGQVFVEPDGGQQQACHLVSEPQPSRMG